MPVKTEPPDTSQPGKMLQVESVSSIHTHSNHVYGRPTVASRSMVGSQSVMWKSPWRVTPVTRDRDETAHAIRK